MLNSQTPLVQHIFSPVLQLENHKYLFTGPCLFSVQSRHQIVEFHC